MKGVQAGSKGMVDLFWNDLCGVEISVERLGSTTTTMKENGFAIYEAGLPSFEDELLLVLWKSYRENTLLSETISEKLKLFPSIKSTLEYFPQAVIHPVHLSHIANNAEFMIRSLGLSKMLIRHLEPVAHHQVRYSKLVDKLADVCTKTLSNNSQGLLDPTKLLEHYARLLKHREDNFD